MSKGRKTIWDLSLAIAGEDKGAKAALNTVKKQIQEVQAAGKQLGGDFRNFASNAGKLALGVVGGVTAAGVAVLGLANSFAETGDRVAKTADRLGMGIEAYQKLSYAMSQSGVNAQQFDQSMQHFSNTIRQGAAGNEAFSRKLQEIGLDARKLANMRPEQAIERISDFMKSLPSDAERTRVAMTLFGRQAGPQMMAALRNGSAGIRELKQEAVGLGIVMTEEQARQSELFMDARTRLRESVNGLRNQFIGASIGPITEAFDHLKGAIVEQMPVIRELGENFGRWLGGMVQRLPEVIARVREFGQWIANTVTRVRDFVGGWRNLGMILGGLAVAPTLISGLRTVWSLGVFIKTAMKSVGHILKGLKVSFAVVAKAALPIIGIIAGIAAAVAAAIFIFRNWERITVWVNEHREALILVGIAVGTLTTAIIAYNAAQAIKNAGGIKAVGVMAAQKISTLALAGATKALAAGMSIAATVGKVFGAVMAFIKSPITIVVLAIGALAAAAFLIVRNWGAIAEFFRNLWEKIKSIFSGIGEWFRERFGGAFEAVTGVINGMAERFAAVFDRIRGMVDAFIGFFTRKFEAVSNVIGGIGNVLGGARNAVSGLFNRGRSEPIPAHADGGIFRNRHIAEISEKGAEAVVPLNNSRRGFDVWKQAGVIGGYIGREQADMAVSAGNIPQMFTPQESPPPSPVMEAAARQISGGDTVVNVDFRMTNNFSGTPDSETANQITQAGQQAGEDFEERVRLVCDKMFRNKARVSYA